jgi:hypothetical protein
VLTLIIILSILLMIHLLINKAMKYIKILWQILDGNKTWICATVLFILQLESVNEALHPDLIIFLNYLFGAGGIFSLTHHILKGKLTRGKN